MHQKTLSTMFTLTLFLIMFTSIVPLGHSVEWSPEMRLTWKSDIDTFPSIIQTSDGLIWVVWCSHRTGNPEIFYKVYNESSVHPWSPETQLTSDTNSDLTPSITQSLNDTIWVVWSSNRTGNHEIYCKTYNGTAWSSDKPLITDPGEDRNPSLMQATNGTIWLVWASKPLEEFDFDILYATSSDNGETWSIQTLPATYPGIDDRDPSITEATDGSIWVVWEISGDLFYTVYYGNSWSPEEQLTTDPYFDVRPSVTQAQGETIWLVWDSDRNLEDEDIYYKTYNGTWSEDTALIINSYIDFAPSILAALDGTIWLTWSSTRLDNMDIYYITDSIPDENDIAIFSVIPSPTIASQGENVSIEVVSQNKGTNAQTFQVSCYTDTTLIGSRTILLDPGQLNLAHFQWDTSSVSLGTYLIWAEASIVAGETDTLDNTYVDGTVTVATHDVAVENVTPSHTIAHRGYTIVNVYVDVRNEGDFTETFDVTAYYNGTAIRTYTVTDLAPNASMALTFPWSAGVSYGNYTISAKASPILNEIDLADNYFIDDTVLVTVPGDVNGDEIVDGLDLSRMDTAYGSSSGKPNWDVDCNINSDAIIDVFDLSLVGRNYGKSST